MSRFLEALRSGLVLLMDGATGTELQRAGAREGECYELWNLTHPDRVRAVHRRYVYAGAQCLLTNTFQSNPAVLAKHGLEDRLEEINEAAVAIARSVCGAKHFVLASIGPVEPVGEQGAALARVAHSLRAADALLLETWPHPLAVQARPGAAADWFPEDLPVLWSLTYRAGVVPDVPPVTQGTVLDPAEVTGWVRGSGVAALGVNCGRDIGMDEVIQIVRLYREVSGLPLFARPNAGTPVRDGDRWRYPHTPAKMAARLPELLEAGVSMVGGCCGTTPEHIAAFKAVVDDWNGRKA